MSIKRHHGSVSLTLVTPDTGSAGRSEVSSNWSELMTRTQGGDRQAYRALLQEMTPYLRSIAARCFKRPSDIEDAVQDVLLTVHTVRQTYDPARPFGPWLVAIANRRIIDRLRRETRTKMREIALSSEHETFSDPAANLERRDHWAAADLNDALDRLPHDQRQAVMLVKLDELSLQEAARASGRSVGSLKVATHRAIKRLRQLLKTRDQST